MKKTFWGYTVKEVDDTIDALTKQNTSLIQRNDHLEDELKNLHVQLEEMKSNMADSMTQAEMDEYKELKAAYAALQNRIQDDVEDSEEMKALRAELAAFKDESGKTEQLHAELISARDEVRQAKQRERAFRTELATSRKKAEQAMQQAEALRAELSAVQEQLTQQTLVASHGEHLNALNDMMKRVGQAICEAQDDTYRSMMDTVDEFVTQWEKSSGELDVLLTEFDAEKEKARHDLADMMQIIQNRFDQMTQKSNTMHAGLSDLGMRREALRASLLDTVEQLRGGNTAHAEAQDNAPAEKSEEKAKTKLPEKTKRRLNLV